jgi:hypothetical protein
LNIGGVGERYHKLNQIRVAKKKRERRCMGLLPRYSESHPILSFFYSLLLSVNLSLASLIFSGGGMGTLRETSSIHP